MSSALDFDGYRNRLAGYSERFIEDQIDTTPGPFDDHYENLIVTSIHQLNNRMRVASIAISEAANDTTDHKLSLAERALGFVRESVNEILDKTNRDLPPDEIEYIHEIIENSRDAIHELRIQLPAEPPELPATRPAPIQAVIKDNILGVANAQNRSGSIDYPSANRVREGLRKTLQGLVEDLPVSSNVDRGYVRACTRLLEYLSTPVEALAIEELGLQYQLVEKVTRRVADEIGAIMLDEIEHVLTGVGVLLNQFDEWRRYLDELAKTKLDPADGEGLVAHGVELIAALEQPDAPVDPELTKRLRTMIEPALTGLVGADTIAIPLVCSLSNIFSTLSQYAIDHHQSLSPNAQHVVLAGSVALLARFSVDLIEKFCPVLSKYQPLAFIISVVRYLLPMYSQGKDVTG